MQHHSFFLVVQVIFSGLFLATILAGIYLWNNFERLFGRDPSMPSENSSARTYSKLQVFSVWTHVFLLTGAFAFLLH